MEFSMKHRKHQFYCEFEEKNLALRHSKYRNNFGKILDTGM